MSSATDYDYILVDRIRRGESQAWDELIGRFDGRLLAFVESRLRNRSVSEDVVQETFIGFLTSLPNYDVSRSLESYLFSIAAHRSFASRRSTPHGSAFGGRQFRRFLGASRGCPTGQQHGP